MKLVLFGAGNIGRSFIAPLFARAGWDVVFVDVNTTIVDALNDRGGYDVVVVDSDAPADRVAVSGVRAIDGRDAAAVAAELATSDLAATAVGKAALGPVSRALAAGLAERRRVNPGRPLDVILAENVRDGAALVRAAVAADVGQTDDLGLIETSIGKMVPIVPADEAARDPLIVYAEPYNTLIVDAKGFRTEVPSVQGLSAVDRIDAYVDRKLFIHNMGHATAAYLGYARDASVRLLSETLDRPSTLERTRTAMEQSADGLEAEYPTVFAKAALRENVDDLLRRFANRALGDTVHRVGRDLPRKLGRDDRIVGAMLLCARHRLPFDAIADAYRAAIGFDCPDESGAVSADDRSFLADAAERGVRWVLTTVSSLDPADPVDARVIAAVIAGSSDAAGTADE